ncbi:MAG TPA: hypothetical protein VGC36_10015 [Rhizomicrobium sp.]
MAVENALQGMDDAGGRPGWLLRHSGGIALGACFGAWVLAAIALYLAF